MTLELQRGADACGFNKNYLSWLLDQQAHGAVLFLLVPVNMPLTVTPLCECMCGTKEVTRSSTAFLPNTLSSLLEPCLAVILKKSELRTDGGGSPRLQCFCFFFPVFLYFFDTFLLFFCVRALRLQLFCGMNNINKRDSRERQKKYTTYITLCYEQNINL